MKRLNRLTHRLAQRLECTWILFCIWWLDLLCILNIHHCLVFTTMEIEQPPHCWTTIYRCQQCGGLFYYHYHPDLSWGDNYSQLKRIDPLYAPLHSIRQASTQDK